MSAFGWLDRLLGSPRDSGEAIVPVGDPERVRAVRRVLDELAPMVAADGGEIVLVAVEGGRVDVRLGAACSHCAASMDTLEGALEPKLRAALPWFTELRRV